MAYTGDGQVGTIAKSYQPWHQSNLTFIPASYKDLTTLFGPRDRSKVSQADIIESEFTLPPSSPYYTLPIQDDPKGDDA